MVIGANVFIFVSLCVYLFTFLYLYCSAHLSMSDMKRHIRHKNHKIVKRERK